MSAIAAKPTTYTVGSRSGSTEATRRVVGVRERKLSAVGRPRRRVARERALVVALARKLAGELDGVPAVGVRRPDVHRAVAVDVIADARAVRTPAREARDRAAPRELRPGARCHVDDPDVALDVAAGVDRDAFPVGTPGRMAVVRVAARQLADVPTIGVH